ncbi:MAG: hypothetical protein AAF570_22485, partial [Bacteroidota bacterium]
TQTFSAAPTFASPSSKAGKWTQAPQTFAMPDRFVIILHHRNAQGNLVREMFPCEPIQGPLQVGPDPDDNIGFQDRGSELDFPAGMKWMADFDEAVEKGMAVRIPLTETFKFESLIALGLDLDAVPTDKTAKVQELLDQHRYTRGLSIIPHGTPTNNTDESDAGYLEKSGSVDELFKAERENLLYQDTDNVLARKDGQWLAEALGLDGEMIGHLMHADGQDIVESLHMNRAMWPGTLRFYLENMMYPTLDEDSVNNTGAFFARFVSGRGMVPSIRVGDQPYSILTTSNFEEWNIPAIGHDFQVGLVVFFLKEMYNSWKRLSENVTSIGFENITETDEALLEVMGLNASSVAFHQRFFGDEDFLKNLENAAGEQPNNQTPDGGSVVDNLQSLGHTMPGVSAIMKMFALEQDRLLNGPLVDGVPVSELSAVEVMDGKTSNYLEWLAEANYEMLQAEDYSILSDQSPDEAAAPDRPRAMLYLMLRHALLLEYANAGFLGWLAGTNS